MKKKGHIEKYNSSKHGQLMVGGTNMGEIKLENAKSNNNQTFNSDVDESPSMKGISTINMVNKYLLIFRNEILIYLCIELATSNIYGWEEGV
jgi:hypothetical protein